MPPIWPEISRGIANPDNREGDFWPISKQGHRPIGSGVAPALRSAFGDTSKSSLERGSKPPLARRHGVNGYEVTYIFHRPVAMTSTYARLSFHCEAQAFFKPRQRRRRA